MAPQATATTVLPLQRVLRRPGFHAGHGQRPGRLEDAARVLEDVLDCRADRVGIDPHDLVDEFTAETKGFLADLLDRGAVAEQIRHP